MADRIEASYVTALDALDGRDSEAMHSAADDLLLGALRALGHESVADAYVRLTERSPWWATA